MPSSTREVLQRRIAELGACSPATLRALSIDVGGLRGAGRSCWCTTCDACTARNALVGLLRALIDAGTPVPDDDARNALVGLLRALIDAGTPVPDDDDAGELFAHVHYCHVCGGERGRVDAAGCHCWEENE